MSSYGAFLDNIYILYKTCYGKVKISKIILAISTALAAAGPGFAQETAQVNIFFERGPVKEGLSQI